MNVYQSSIQELDSLLDEAMELLDKAEYDKADEVAYTALRMMENLSSSTARAHISAQHSRVYRLLGLIQKSRGNLSLALELVLKGLHIAEQHKDKRNIAKCMTNVGMLYQIISQYSLSLEYLLKAKSIHEELEDTRSLSRVHANLGVVYIKLSENVKALEYINKALALKRKVGDLLGESNLYNSLGLLYYKDLAYELAIENYERSVAIKEQLGDTFGLGIVFSNIADIYAANSEHSKALEYIEKALDSRKAIGSAHSLPTMLLKKAEILHAIKDSSAAIDLLLLSLDISVKSNLLTEQSASCKFLAEIYRNLGDFASAYKYMQQYQELYELIRNEESSRRIAELEFAESMRRTEADFKRAQRDAAIAKDRNDELQKALAQLRATNSELEASNKAVTELSAENKLLLAIASHDMRSPLSVIEMNVQSLLETPPETEQERVFALQEIAYHSARMNKLLQSILEISALEQNETPCDLEIFQCKEVVEFCVASLTPLATTKGINFVLHIDEPSHIVADYQQLIRVVENLLSNAVKYATPNTNVEVSVRRSAAKTTIVVSNHGKGIKPEEIPLLFKKFQKLSTRPTAGESSSGLGLAIVHKLCERMKASVWCTSVYGTSATFNVEFQSAHN